MKKSVLYSLLALGMGMGLASCDGFEAPNPPAQSNPQEAIFEVDGVKITANASTKEVIDLQLLNEADEVAVLSDVEAPGIPEGYHLEPVMELCADNTFGNVAEVKVNVVDLGEGNYNITASPDVLQGAFYSVVSHGPGAKKVFYRYALYLANGDMKAQVGDKYFQPYEMTIKPIPGSTPIEDAYYLIGTACNWNMSKAIKFNHSGADPYEDPVFTLRVEITNDQAYGDGWWWKVIPASTFAAGEWVDAPFACFGVAENGDESTTGILVGRTATEDCGAGKITEPGTYVLTINLEEGTYEFAEAPGCLWTPGNSNDWTHDKSQLLQTTDGTEFKGFAHLNGDFKFTNQANWKGTNYGLDTENTGDGNLISGTLSTDGGAGNLNAPKDGLWYCIVNTDKLTFEATYCTLGIIGANGDWEHDIAMTPSADFLTWKGEFNATSDTEFKVRANGGWDINLGGSASNLTQGGDNIKVKAGYHKITLKLSEIPYVMVIE